MGLLSDSGGGSNYLVYKHQSKNFWLGKEDIVEFGGLIIDVDSVKTGWGIFVDGYQYQWDERPGIRLPKPADIGEEYWKNAFSIDVYLKDTEQTVLWRSITVGNTRAFDALTDTYLNEIDNKKPGQVGAFKSLKDDKGFLKVAYKDEKQNTSWPLFEFSGWIDRPEKFVERSNDYPGVDPVEKSSVNESDIPF
tara:strand:+ start:674 stop:1252 length:579 start_codon:yes stop_codon:yes gene_type:complete